MTRTSMLSRLLALTALFFTLNLIGLFRTVIHTPPPFTPRDFQTKKISYDVFNKSIIATNLKYNRSGIIQVSPIVSNHTIDTSFISLCKATTVKCTVPNYFTRMYMNAKIPWTKRSPRLVSIRGERHSGTKLTRSLIQKNAFGLLDTNTRLSFADQLYGWKHGYFLSDGEVHPSDIILILVRDVFSWALAMFKEPYNIMFEEGTTDFGTFLRGYYRTHHCEPTYGKIPKQCSFPMEQANNIIQLRTAKYKNWTSMANTTFSLIQYEQLANNQSLTMTRFFQEFVIPMKQANFYSLNHYIGYNNEEVKPLTEHAPKKLQDRYKKLYSDEQVNFTLDTRREKYLSQYTIEEIEFVLDNLDLAFEKAVLKYSYEDVQQYLVDRRLGRKNYTGPPKLDAEVYKRRMALIQSWKNGSITCNQYQC